MPHSHAHTPALAARPAPLCAEDEGTELVPWWASVSVPLHLLDSAKRQATMKRSPSMRPAVAEQEGEEGVPPLTGQGLHEGEVDGLLSGDAPGQAGEGGAAPAGRDAGLQLLAKPSVRGR